jgi:hypothetical protein
MDELTDLEREVLTFERQWWKYAGAKESEVRERFGLSATRYYQLVNALIDKPVALVHDPMLVKRLRRLRATRQQQRRARPTG